MNLRTKMSRSPREPILVGCVVKLLQIEVESWDG